MQRLGDDPRSPHRFATVYGIESGGPAARSTSCPRPTPGGPARRGRHSSRRVPGAIARGRRPLRGAGRTGRRLLIYQRRHRPLLSSTVALLPRAGPHPVRDRRGRARLAARIRGRGDSASSLRYPPSSSRTAPRSSAPSTPSKESPPETTGHRPPETTMPTSHARHDTTDLTLDRTTRAFVARLEADQGAAARPSHARPSARRPAGPPAARRTHASRRRPSGPRPPHRPHGLRAAAHRATATTQRHAPGEPAPDARAVTRRARVATPCVLLLVLVARTTSALLSAPIVMSAGLRDVARRWSPRRWSPRSWSQRRWPPGPWSARPWRSAPADGSRSSSTGSGRRRRVQVAFGHRVRHGDRGVIALHRQVVPLRILGGDVTETGAPGAAVLDSFPAKLACGGVVAAPRLAGGGIPGVLWPPGRGSPVGRRVGRRSRALSARRASRRPPLEARCSLHGAVGSRREGLEPPERLRAARRRSRTSARCAVSGGR